jgi:hypothetical protein
MKKHLILAISSFFVFGKTIAQKPGQVKILFDNTHAETSGSGDWCIDADYHNLDWNPTGNTGTSGSYYHSNPLQYPTPTQTTVTSATAETYWEGALSYWGIDCVNWGYWVESLPFTGHITYGTSTNAQDLSNYNVFIVDEPNIVFTAAEKTAMMNFVSNGGSLFMISDHTGSDRNNDGWDSPAIWNDFLTNNGVQNNGLGFTFALQNFSDANYNSNVSTVSADSITRGHYGNVSEVKWSNGTCMTLNPMQNPSVKGHVWKNGKGQTDTAVVCTTVRYGCGKVAAIGDSSPPDDGTGNTGTNNQITLYTGYTGDANGNHRPWLMNMTIWLADTSVCSSVGIKTLTENNMLTIYPNPANEKVVINFSNNTENNAVFNLINMNGQLVSVPQTHQKNYNEEQFILDTTTLPTGVYYCKVQTSAGDVSIKKLVILN